MKISIADNNSSAESLAKFFVSNVTSDYISHGELQGYRAAGYGKWADNLESVVQAETMKRLHNTLHRFPFDDHWAGVIEARDDGALVGLAFVTLSREAIVPFGVIEDLVIDKRRRSAGRGETVMNWILENFRRAGIGRVFLESGQLNESAHRFFEHMGFKPVSVTMMRDL